MKTVKELTSDLCNILVDNYMSKSYYPGSSIQFTFEEGNKFLKVIKIDYNSRSVHAFVDKNNGDLYKADSWKKAAKGVRFNLFNDIEALRNVADWAGGYLYR